MQIQVICTYIFTILFKQAQLHALLELCLGDVPHVKQMLSRLVQARDVVLDFGRRLLQVHVTHNIDAWQAT